MTSSSNITKHLPALAIGTFIGFIGSTMARPGQADVWGAWIEFDRYTQMVIPQTMRCYVDGSVFGGDKNRYISVEAKCRDKEELDTFTLGGG